MSSSITPGPASGAQLILDVAGRLFARDGFDAVSIAQIAEHAEVSKANIFHHFRSKEALYLDVVRKASLGHAEFAEALLREDLGSAEKLRRLARWEFEDNYRNEGRVHMLVREVFSGGCDQVRQLAREVFKRNYEAVTSLFVQGQGRGEFRQDFEAGVAAMMLGATSSMYAQTHAGLRGFRKAGPLDDPRKFADAFCDLLLPSIVVVPSHSSPKIGTRKAVRRKTVGTRTPRSRKS